MIYIHVPFCASHCTYCAFYSELLRPGAGSSEGVCATGLFVQAVRREIEECLELHDFPEKESTLYIGGGTPSLLSTCEIGSLADAVRKYADITEFTVEVNPDDVVKKGRQYAEGLRKVGVNRISMGIQSFNDDVLRRMGRRHRSLQSMEAYALLREAGFRNISVDFIFGFAWDCETDGIKKGLDALCSSTGSLPEHISCYQLGVEEGSGLEKMLSKGLWSLPDDDSCADTYYGICSLLEGLGYEHYEISNWAKPLFRSVHNSAYWTHKPYFGFGPGAHSLLVEGHPVRYVRRWNNPDLAAYHTAAGAFEKVRGEETLTREQLLEERIFLGLRTSEGIAADLLPGDKVEKALREGSLVCSAASGRLRIPENKWFVSDSIIQSLF